MQTKFSDTILEINLKAIRNNFKFFKDRAKSAEISCVVKADAYGLGVSNIAPMFEKLGCRIFFVATLDEAIYLRKFISISSDIYVLHGIKQNEISEFEKHYIYPVLNDISQIELYSEFAKKISKKLKSIIHFDTGMNRLGVDYFEAERLKKSDLLKNLEITYLMSHLACISDLNHQLNNLQLQRSKTIHKIFSEYKFSLCNSRGVMAGDEFHFNLIRPGSGLYGICGTLCKEKLIKNVVTIKAKIIQIRKVSELGSVGYGGTVEAKIGQRLAIIPVGYADGYIRSLGNNANAYFKGYRLPLLGIVSMDLTIFDISQIPENEINIGDELELLGDNITIDEVAKSANTIGYEILTRLGDRYIRKYVE
jgi:alanine racemase